MKDKIKTTTINLWRIDDQVVRKYADERGLSFSAALRQIIRDWDAQRKQNGTNESRPTG